MDLLCHVTLDVRTDELSQGRSERGRPGLVKSRSASGWAQKQSCFRGRHAESLNHPVRAHVMHGLDVLRAFTTALAATSPSSQA